MSDQSRAELFLTQELGISELDAARERLGTMSVVLAVSPELANVRLAQISSLTSANILCRLGPFCRSIALSIPEHASVQPGVPLLAEGAPLALQLLEYMTSVQLPAEWSTRSYRLANADEVFDQAFSVGPSDVAARRTLYGWYDRWTGGYASQPRRSGYSGPNPFGALIAGALGATGITRLLLEVIADRSRAPMKLPSEATLSAYSYGQPDRPSHEPEIPPVIDLQVVGPSILVGGGAIASGVAFALATLEQVHGELEVIDDDLLDATNLERHLISGVADIGTAKVVRLATLFNSGNWNGLRLTPHVCRYEALKSKPWGMVLATVDQAEARRRLQFDLPRTLLNAGTIGSEFLVSRHDYGEGPCAECLYPERPAVVHSPVEMLAAQTGLNAAEVQGLLKNGAHLTAAQAQRIMTHGRMIFSPEVLAGAGREGIRVLAHAACTSATIRPGLPVATISFVAALPGILLGAELVREAIQHASSSTHPCLAKDRNVFRMDTFGDFTDTVEISVASRTCRCQTAVMRSAYARRWASEAE